MTDTADQLVARVLERALDEVATLPAEILLDRWLLAILDDEAKAFCGQ